MRPESKRTHWDPIRNGNSLDNGQQRFANFVRNIGRATADIGEGDGGSYGVGKSALWMASECGTILIHTRTTDSAGEPVERFIGSVHGEFFVPAINEFTGRHFIGAQPTTTSSNRSLGRCAAAAAGGLPLPSYTHDGEASRWNLDRDRGSTATSGLGDRDESTPRCRPLARVAEASTRSS